MSDAAEKVLISCPSCGKQYRIPVKMAGKQASCKCGSVFSIRKAMEATAEEVEPMDEALPVEPVQASPTDCAFHPGTPALVACAECRKLLCKKCSYSQHDGRHLCAQCAILSASPTLGNMQAFSSAVVAGTCQVHRDVEAKVRCKYCNMLMCDTCDFRFPRDVHLCARCATTIPKGLSRSRKILLVGSLVALGWVLLVTGVKLAVAAMLPGDTSPVVFWALQAVLLALVVQPSMIGFGLACGSFSRQEENPPLVWVSLGLNSLMSVLWLVMMIVQMMRNPFPSGA